MIVRRLTAVAIAVVLCAGAPSRAFAQQQRRPASTGRQPRSTGIGIAGYATFGRINFAAARSFDAILGDSGGPLVGGGVRVDLHMGGLFFDVGAWRFQQTGERAFIFQDRVIQLGIPVEVTAVPLEMTGGWRFSIKRWPRLIPYAAAGLTSIRYREDSDFSTSQENDDKTFAGPLVRAGAEIKILKWVGVGGEATWSSLPDALGDGGVSQAFKETDLGGTSFRFMISVGR
jgi:hypothetical protein